MSKIFATMLLSFVISFKLLMQYDHFLEKLNFDLLTPFPGSGGGSAGKKNATMLLHFVIIINLVCNITMF